MSCLQRRGSTLLMSATRLRSPYSCDLSPIEPAFHQYKCALRRARPSTNEELVGTVPKCLDSVTPENAARYYAHCGYCDGAVRAGALWELEDDAAAAAAAASDAGGDDSDSS